MTTETRGRGRPRTRPADATPLAARFTAAERVKINTAAARAGLSAAQWMRRTVLRAAGAG